ncbi:MAG TPA: hypothetical protein VE093_41120 [Polyangiaceae bacterium]|jgi:hypothetical protein|nr:hypothetical protein [Polyangiaceae bacterium]
MNAKHVVWLGLLAAIGFGCEASTPEELTEPGADEATESLTREDVECSKDSDCRVEATYCTGCDCVALGPDQQAPECQGPGVQCFNDPCVARHAVCDNNTCVIE